MSSTTEPLVMQPSQMLPADEIIVQAFRERIDMCYRSTCPSHLAQLIAGKTGADWLVLREAIMRRLRDGSIMIQPSRGAHERLYKLRDRESGS